MSPQDKAAYEAQHPRTAKGRTGGGQWVKKQGDGMEGQPDPEVAQLQQGVNAALGSKRLAVDGRFGPVTAEGVKAFQKANGINANGIVDDNTREAMLNPPPTSRATAQAEVDQQMSGKKTAATATKRAASTGGGSTSSGSGSGGRSSSSSGGTRSTTRSSTSSGSAASTAGVDPTSIDSIESFQRKHGLKVDGIIGPDTQREMRRERDRGGDGNSISTADGESGDGNTISDKPTEGLGRSGSKDEGHAKQVKRLQKMLQDLGYDLGEGGTDGKFGAATESAVKKLQRQYGLNASGRIDRKTLSAINRLEGRLNSEKKAEGTGKAPRDGYKVIESTWEDALGEAKEILLTEALGRPTRDDMDGDGIPHEARGQQARQEAMARKKRGASFPGRGTSGGLKNFSGMSYTNLKIMEKKLRIEGNDPEAQEAVAAELQRKSPGDPKEARRSELSAEVDRLRAEMEKTTNDAKWVKLATQLQKAKKGLTALQEGASDDMGDTMQEADTWGGKPGTNFKQVTPENRKKVNPLVRHYMKQAHPFTACVRDNTKRFGEERAKKVCAVVKDMGEGTTKWRKGSKKVQETMAAEYTDRLIEAGIVDDYGVRILEAYLLQQDALVDLQEATTGIMQASARGRLTVAERRLQEAEVRPVATLAEAIATLNPGSSLRTVFSEVTRLTGGGGFVVTTVDPEGERWTRKKTSSAQEAANVISANSNLDAEDVND